PNTPVRTRPVRKEMREARGNGTGWAISPTLYWRLFRFSPLIMLIGMAAGGVLIIRSILVWGVEDEGYSFGLDIPISGAVLVLWAAAATLLLVPLPAIRARTAIGSGWGPALVWPLGRRFRVWNVVA